MCSTEIRYDCCRLLALMSSLHARYHTKCDVALFSLQTVPRPCSDAVLRSCEEALAGIILHRPPSLWFAWVRSGCAGPLAGSRGGLRKGGGDTMGGGGLAARDPRSYIEASYPTIACVDTIHGCIALHTGPCIHCILYHRAEVPVPVCMNLCKSAPRYNSTHACIHIYIYTHQRTCTQIKSICECQNAYLLPSVVFPP